MHKDKIGISLSPEVLALEEINRRRLGFSSRSEFIEAAIREYVGRDILREYHDDILHTYQTLERTELRDMEDRLAKLAYKIAVEMAQVNLILLDAMEYSYPEAQSLRGKAVGMVNRSHGMITLPQAAKQRE